MLQNAIVTAVNQGDGTAEVVVERAALCGGDCSKCEACMYENTIKTTARNTAGAHPGQQVLVETDTGSVMLATFIIYLLPLALFFAGYGAGALCGLTQGVNILLAFGFLAIGFVISHFVMKSKQTRPPNPVAVVSIKYDV